ncbi:MAG: YHYH protein [Hellea sp.]|nr:YHYH protein [Hellea sp.]
MQKKHYLLILGAAAWLGACQSDPVQPGASATDLPAWAEEIDRASLIGGPELVDCTLSGGAKTKCVSLTMKPKPASLDIGPFCPRHIDDGPEQSGLWLNDGKMYDADGAFIKNLSTFYGDDNWQLYDPVTGKINVTDTKLSCEAAARPDVAPEYQNHCVECDMSYLPDGQSTTYVIPVVPQAAAQIAPRVDHGGVGLALNGARLDAAAPIDAILAAYTIAAFDDCGGHINPNVGYHIHAVTDCLTGTRVNENHAPRIGIAMDG